MGVFEVNLLLLTRKEKRYVYVLLKEAKYQKVILCIYAVFLFIVNLSKAIYFYI